MQAGEEAEMQRLERTLESLRLERDSLHSRNATLEKVLVRYAKE